MAVTLKVNGASRSVPAEPDTPLLYVLRNDLELNGAKFGCGLAQCGACTVLVDGKAVRSCVTDIGSLVGAEITTLEGLGTIAKPHPIQQAFIDEQAVQCGFCINGVIMTAKALLDRNPKAGDQQIFTDYTPQGQPKTAGSGTTVLAGPGDPVRYLLVWISKLPQTTDNGQYVVQVQDIKVLVT